MYIFICKKQNKTKNRGWKREKNPRGPCGRPVLKKKRTRKKKPPHRPAPPHSMTSPGATVTNCKGISWLATRSWVVAVWRMSVVPSAVMTASVEGGDVEEGTPPFLFWWVFMCLARWSLRMNLLEHSVHTNFFSPVCVLLCLCSSSLLVNLFPQNIQLQTKGLSPLCQRRWARRWDVFP